MKNFLFIFLLACTQVMAQGLTSSSVGGRVLDDQSEALIGSTIVVTHQPTGSVYGATTDFDGYYRVSGLRSEEGVQWFLYQYLKQTCIQNQ